MTKQRRTCACRRVIESEVDEASLSTALRAHYAQPEHQEYVAAAELETELLPRLEVRVRPNPLAVPAVMRRVG